MEHLNVLSVQLVSNCILQGKDARKMNRNPVSSSLRRKSRLEILTLLVSVMEENEALKIENEQLKQRLAARDLSMKESGTLAEACLQLSGIFEAADRAIALFESARKAESELTESSSSQAAESCLKKVDEESAAETASFPSSLIAGDAYAG